MCGLDKIRLLALDLDGTLLADDKSIPEENREVLKRLKEAGIQTAICSGRALPGMKAILAELGTERIGRYHIGLNGGLLYDAVSDRVIEGYPIGEQAVRKVIALGRSQETEINIQLYTKEEIYIEKRCSSTAVYEGLNHCRLTQIPDLMEKAAEAIKIIFILHESDQWKGTEKIKALEDRMAPLLPEETVGCCSCEYLYEVLARDRSKGSALKRLAERLAIPREKVMAMGDNENDRTMLEYAGYPVTLRNAEPDIQKLCRYVSKRDNNNGGMAEAIREIIFSEME